MSEEGTYAASSLEEAGRMGGSVGHGPDPEHAVRLDTRESGYVPPELARYLLRSEAHVLAMRLHPAALARETAICLGGLAAAVTLNSYAYAHHAATPILVHTIWILWLAAALWYTWKAVVYRHTWLAITPVRIIKVSGLIRRRVSPLPMKRARDVEMRQTLAGRWLDYGTLYTQSFGTDHQLAQIPYVPDVQAVFNAVWEILLPERGVSPMPGETM